jgi:hypothetical protein
VSVTSGKLKLHAFATSALLLGAAAYPAFLPPRQDGFPLSTYPMFATAKPERVAVMSALALGDGAFEAVLAPSYVANAEAMQALSTLRKTVATGRRSARKLCEQIAARVAAKAEPRLASARHVALVTQEHDAVRYLSGDTEPLSRKVHVRCAVPMRLEVKP